MEATLRASIRRTIAVLVVVAAVSVGWMLHGVTSASHDAGARHHPANLSASDLLLAAQTASAGIYLQFDGITGPAGPTYAQDAKVQSFSFGVSRSPSTTSGTRGGSTPNISDITISHNFDKYSAPLFQQSLTGGGSNKAVLYFTSLNAKNLPVKYLEIDLTDVLVTSFQTSSGGTAPNESISLNVTGFTLIAHVTGAPQQTVTYTIP
jgi:type VI protein secretion system component Hcp